jgi:hypothetical protein
MIYPNIRAENYAVGKSSGQLRLFLGKSEVANSTTRPQVSGASVRSIVVPSVSLDDYIHTHALTIPDMIKVDVEGGEYEVLLGAQNLINTDQPPAWFVEVNTDFLDQRGLSVAALQKGMKPNGAQNLYHRLLWNAQRKPLVAANIGSRFRGNVVWIPEQRLRQYSDFIDWKSI